VDAEEGAVAVAPVGDASFGEPEVRRESRELDGRV
jgi:hypothetical protein